MFIIKKKSYRKIKLLLINTFKIALQYLLKVFIYLIEFYTLDFIYTLKSSTYLFIKKP